MHARNSIVCSLTGLAILLTLTNAPWPLDIADRAYAEEIDCPEGDDSMECRARAGDRIALYVLGRESYDEARVSGDFSEALRLSRQLREVDDKNGKRLSKMVHMQLGWGAHNDYVQAYIWLSEAIAAGDDYLDTWRDTLAEKMTPDQLEQAKALSGQ